MTIKSRIRDIISKTIGEQVDFTVESPENENFGDYATNVALVLAKKLKKNPMEIAESIKSKINNDFFRKIEIVPPGFINFFLSQKFLQEQIETILKKENEFGKLDIGKNKKVQVEFISSNPTGPLTVANARGGPMGDVLANIFNFAGYKAEKEFCVNNSGMQILALGHSILKDNEVQYKGDYINKLSKKIKEKDPYKAGEKAAKIIVDKMIKRTTDKLGIKYDKWFFESDLHKTGKIDKIIKLLKDKRLLYEKENAIWFKSSEFGDTRDRVLIKKDGEKTYLANDIAYHYNKFQERKFDKVINIWGADHHGNVPGLMAGVEAIGHKGKLDVILCQFLTILEKGKKIKMSKRQGNFVAMDELLKMVGRDVVRFFFLMYSANRHMDFSLDLAKEKSEKNPVYYVQYAYARINSILKKAKSSKIKDINLSLLSHPTELDLIKELVKFPEIIEDTAMDYQVQRLPHYTLNLSAYFHKFYTECKVLGGNKELEKSRLALAVATKIVLENALDLMGISKPKKM